MAEQHVLERAAGDAAPEACFKLRYASHLGMLRRDLPLFAATLGTVDPVAHIEYAASLGFAGMEDNLLLGREPGEQSAIGEALAKHGLEMGCFVASFAPGKKMWVTDDEASAQEIDADIDKAIEAAKRVNGKYLVIAPARDLSPPLSYQFAIFAKHLRRVAQVCERAGMMICMEQTNSYRLPGMLLDHIADAYNVAKAVDSPAVKLLFDFFHVQLMDGNLVGNFHRCYDEIAVLQIADLPARGDLGASEVHWTNVLRAVRDRGYTGLIEYEMIPSQQGRDGEQAALDALRRVDAAI